MHHVEPIIDVVSEHQTSVGVHGLHTVLSTKCSCTTTKHIHTWTASADFRPYLLQFQLPQVCQREHITMQVVIGNSCTAELAAYASARPPSSRSGTASDAMSHESLVAKGYTHAAVEIPPQKGPAESKSWSSTHGLKGLGTLGTSMPNEAGNREFDMPGIYFVTFLLYPLLPGPAFVTEQPVSTGEPVNGHTLGPPARSPAYKIEVVRSSPEHADECICRGLSERTRIGGTFSLSLELRLETVPVDLANFSFARLKLHSAHLDCG